VLAWQREAQARGSQLKLSGLPPDLLSLATVYGVAPLLHIAETAG
jgi:ABC-type transporter Mla MlaB component